MKCRYFLDYSINHTEMQVTHAKGCGGEDGDIKKNGS